jgi:flagellar hook-associated protein 3 FlgL
MSSLRVNPDLLPDLLAELQRARLEADTATLELGSGSRINKPSDDPAGAAQMVANRDQSSVADSFLRSIASVNGLLHTADSTLSSVVTALQRAISLGVQGANGTLSDSDRMAIAEEVNAIKQQLVGLGNTAYQGEYIFGGTSTAQPFVNDTSSSSGISYKGNGGTNSVAVGEGYSLQENLPGSQVFSAPGSDTFQALSDLVTALRNGNSDGAGLAVSALNAAYDHVTQQRVFYGNAMNQLLSQQNYLSAEKLNLSTAANSISGADLAASATKLSQAQLAVNAELAAMSRINQTSLFDYLK